MAQHRHDGPTPDALPNGFTPIASQGAIMGVDWESRVDFNRLRHEDHANFPHYAKEFDTF